MTSMPRSCLFAMAKAIALMTSLVLPEPVLSSTFITIRRAPGATPLYWLPLAPLLPTRPAMCVPWP